ncbi:HNH endonuclease family protein [Rhodovulum sulfidophilum]|uniref:HNH endonuclease n=2 Tax=Rhodovulum sulfidophilum TaxID=35806 RepID=A0ABS1RWZ4_RHOSU|nr:HNH endonuclease family protein [Rhodovulum sulfidophilum]MBL3610626.1 HNH endonuclease [Rhodovulum sulfidophilum]
MRRLLSLLLLSLTLLTCAPVAQAPQSVAPALPYERAAFGSGWTDPDGDCLDTRAELLADLSTVPVRLAPSGCSVRHGRWFAPYTGQVVTEAGDLDIDHIVPLRYAWGHGAASWSAQKRARFARDPVNLLPVSASANRSKGARGPLDWLPPDPGFRCQYVLRFRRIAASYGLVQSAAEERELVALTGRLCGA